MCKGFKCQRHFYYYNKLDKLQLRCLRNRIVQFAPEGTNAERTIFCMLISFKPQQ